MDRDKSEEGVPVFVPGSALDALSVAELEEIIGMLGDEIIRLEAEIRKKNASRSAAENVFKS